MSSPVDRLTRERDELRDVLLRHGYRRCDIAACNCNGWHGGHSAQRLSEIRDALDEAGIDMNGKTILQGVLELKACAFADDDLRSASSGGEQGTETDGSRVTGCTAGGDA